MDYRGVGFVVVAGRGGSCRLVEGGGFVRIVVVGEMLRGGWARGWRVGRDLAVGGVGGQRLWTCGGGGRGEWWSCWWWVGSVPEVRLAVAGAGIVVRSGVGSSAGWGGSLAVVAI